MSHRAQLVRLEVHATGQPASQVAERLVARDAAWAGQLAEAIRERLPERDNPRGLCLGEYFLIAMIGCQAEQVALMVERQPAEARQLAMDILQQLEQP